MNAQTTGSFIAELRGKKGLTQAELAEKLMVSDKAISRWETGRGLPDIENLEALSRVLDTSMAELLQGKRIDDPSTSNTADEIATSALDLVHSFMKRRSFLNLACGFLAGLVIVTLVTVHLVSPITLQWNAELLELEQLDNGVLVAIASPELEGISTEVNNRGVVFASAYTTRYHQLITGSDAAPQIVRLGNLDDNEAIYYYPSLSGDMLIYATEDFDAGEGVQTLPRLVYNMWIVIGALASVVGFVAYALLRKRWYAMYVLRIALIPLCCTIATIATLWGHFGEVYDASFYVSGILLLACALYALALALIARTRRT